MIKPTRAANAVGNRRGRDLTHEGEGVVRDPEAGGKTVFVAGALPGERVSFRRRSFHKSHDEAELLEILEASPTA